MIEEVEGDKIRYCSLLALYFSMIICVFTEKRCYWSTMSKRSQEEIRSMYSFHDSWLRKIVPDSFR